MLARWSGLVDLKPGEAKLVFSLITLLALNTLVLQSVDIVAITNFIGGSGVQKIVLLFGLETIITWVLAAFYSLIIDRVARLRLIGWVLLVSAALYLAMLAVLVYDPNADPNFFAMLYILETQQQNMFPLVFWALVNELYSVTDSGRIFPIIGAGVPAGRILGSLLAAGSTLVFVQRLQNARSILSLGIILLLLQWWMLRRIFRGQTIHARLAAESKDPKAFFTALVGIDLINNVPAFFYLAIGITAAGLLLTILWYNFFLFGYLDFGDGSLRFQTFYANYSTGFNIALLLIQLFLVSRLRNKVMLQSTFVVLPATFIVALLANVLIGGVPGALVGLFIAQTVRWAWDKPAYRSVYDLVPDERRGRVSIFFESTLFPLGTLLGCFIVQWAIAYNLRAFQIEQWFLRPEVIVAMGIALLALWATWRLRAKYEDSLLNWRLARAKRKSVLDGVNLENI